MTSDLPSHPVLAAVATNLERYRWAALISDHEMRMVWFSSEYWAIFGDVVATWHGMHWAEFSLSEEFRAKSTDRSVMRGGFDILPMLIDHTPGGRERVREILASILGPEVAGIVDRVPDHQDPVWSTSIRFAAGEGMTPVRTSGLITDIRDRDGTLLGAAAVFFAALPFRLVSVLARGDEDALERMARLTKPGQRSAAIMFADVQASGLLSRRLPSAVYFRLIRSLITAIDQVVVDHGGIVGRHAGDGVTAFFLTDDLSSPAAAARAAIEAAREIRTAASAATEEVRAETAGVVSAADCSINVGLHWGGSLYMGQLNTGGRLEVTALGDAVNECARIQETARDGRILISKALLEFLDPDEAPGLGLDPGALSYTTIAQIPGASEKAIRDAGSIAVIPL